MWILKFLKGLSQAKALEFHSAICIFFFFQTVSLHHSKGKSKKHTSKTFLHIYDFLYFSLLYLPFVVLVTFSCFLHQIFPVLWMLHEQYYQLDFSKSSIMPSEKIYFLISYLFITVKPIRYVCITYNIVS